AWSLQNGGAGYPGKVRSDHAALAGSERNRRAACHPALRRRAGAPNAQSRPQDCSGGAVGTAHASAASAPGPAKGARVFQEPLTHCAGNKGTDPKTTKGSSARTAARIRPEADAAHAAAERAAAGASASRGPSLTDDSWLSTRASSGATAQDLPQADQRWRAELQRHLLELRRRTVESQPVTDILDLDDPATMPPQRLNPLDTVTAVTDEPTLHRLRHVPSPR